MLTLEAASVLRAGGAYTLHIQDAAGPWRFPEHTHRGFGDLLLVEHGRIEQRLNGRRVELAAGDLLLVRPADRHALHGSGFRFHNLNLPVDEWERLERYAGTSLPMAALRSARTPPLTRLAAGERRRVLGDLAELVAAQGGAGARPALARFLLRWLAAFAGRQRAAGQPPAWLGPLLRRIEEGVGHGLAVADLPRLAGVSQAHLARSFRRHLATTPSQHLNRVRLDRAAQALAGSERPVLDIAFGLGFHSASYFYRLFQRAFAVPPAAFRARHRMGMKMP